MQPNDPEFRSRPKRPLRATPSAAEGAGKQVKQPKPAVAKKLKRPPTFKPIQIAKLERAAQEAADGRDQLGRFAPGNKHGRGNPFARQVQILRSAIYHSFDPYDLHAIVRALVKQAKRGNAVAAKLLLDRSLGRMQEIDRQIAEAEKYDEKDDFVGDPKYL